MINLSEAPDGFAFGKMQRSAKKVKDREYRRIFLQASEIDSPLPRKVRRTDMEMPSSLASDEFKSLQPNNFIFHANTWCVSHSYNSSKNCREKSFGLPATGSGRKSSGFEIRVETASAKQG